MIRSSLKECVCLSTFLQEFLHCLDGEDTSGTHFHKDTDGRSKEDGKERTKKEERMKMTGDASESEGEKACTLHS